MPNSVVVLGTQWGDEGKGKIVDLLSKSSAAVVRFQGGHNAGHTLVFEGQKTILHLLPSAALHPNVECLIGNGVVVNIRLLLQEIDMLKSSGISLSDRLRISYACPLVLPHHVALDMAREKLRGNHAIGTTGKGIGPAYEDKVARRGLRLGDLTRPDFFAVQLKEVMGYHNHILQTYFNAKAVDYSQTLDETLQDAERIFALLDDVPARIFALRDQGKAIMYEGAQGSLLDIDHGTYPYVTSSNTTAATAATGSGVGPLELDYVLGITKAYTTRVGAGPFPTELCDQIGAQLAVRGKEVGATTGRPRRCGWLDMVALRRARQVSGIRGLCVTKMDVMDELDEVKICTHYRYKGEKIDLLPYGAAAVMECEPIYQTMPGWRQAIAGIRCYNDLPQNAKRYLERISELSGLSIDLISTGAERNDTIMLNNPFEACQKNL